MAAPFSRLFRPERRRATLIVLALVTVAFGVAALPSLGDMQDHGVGIVELEFTGTAEKAADHYAELGPGGRSAARTSLLLDYGYLVGYGLLLAAACVAVADRARRAGRTQLAALGPALAWGALAAAACDAVENGALLLILDGHTDQPWPAIAFACASVKFALAASASLYALGGWLVTLGRTAAA